MVSAPHPESVIRWAGRDVQLKVHQCVWSGEYVANSLPAILDCYHAHVARAEIDIAMLRDEDFLIVHDRDLEISTDGKGCVDATSRVEAERLHLRQHGEQTSQRVATLSEVVSAIAAEPYPTLLELDLKDERLWPWPRVEELARTLQPVKHRITFGGGADWNLRRLQRVDTTMPMGFTIGEERLNSIPGYLRDRLETMLGLVPNARDIHIRLVFARHMVEDGLADLAELLHRRGMLLDVWTLNAGTPDWQDRLKWALEAGADVITTETPHELASAIAA